MNNFNLQTWFGLSRASFCVLPRVFMEAMPDEWQEQMAELLHQYDDSINTGGFGIDSVIVQAKTVDGKFMTMPEDILNYRHPSPGFIESIRKHPPCPRCGCVSSRPNGEHYCHQKNSGGEA